MMKLLNRGMTHLSQSGKHAERIVDCRGSSSPLDVIVVRESVKSARRYHRKSEIMQIMFTLVETFP